MKEMDEAGKEKFTQSLSLTYKQYGIPLDIRNDMAHMIEAMCMWVFNIALYLLMNFIAHIPEIKQKWKNKHCAMWGTLDSQVPQVDNTEKIG